MYQGQPPWDIGKPQNPFIENADQITGTVLEPLCAAAHNGSSVAKSIMWRSSGCWRSLPPAVESNAT
jgi:hypothetical protein